MKRFVPKIIKLKDAFNREIIIPRYQRNYSWDTDKISDLLTDILNEFRTSIAIEKTKQNFNQYKEDLMEHMASSEMFYLGQIVYEENYIVDGQQRLTSLQIIFRALNDYLCSNDWNPLKGVATLFESVDGLRIFPAKIDEENSKIIQDLEKSIPDYIDGKTNDSKIFKRSNFYKNYQKVFSELVKEKLVEAEVINLKYFILNYIEIMKVEIPSTSDAIVFFEVMNSKSLPLTPADLIKNNILKSNQNSDGDAGRWNNIADELNHKNADLSKYIRYLYVAKVAQVSKAKLFNEIKNNKTFDVLELMEGYLESYKILVGTSTDSDQVVDSLIYAIRTLGASESLSPILLEILYRLDEDTEKVINLLKNLATFAYKFFFKQGFKANNYSTIVSVISKNIANNETSLNINVLDGLWNKYDSEMKASGRTEVHTFGLSDVEFNSDSSKSAKKFAKALMPLLYALKDSENSVDEQEITSSITINYDTLDIEHIYPKTKTDDWAKLDDEGDLWKLGNLVPLSQSKNRAAGNADFKSKHNLYMGLDDEKTKKSSFYISLVNELDDKVKITEDTIWNSEMINKRNIGIVNVVNKYKIFTR